jgi:uncharacterized membrane protein YhaH (DUF805 family)
MQALRFLFSPRGRIAPRAFAIAVIAVYAAGIASQWLTVPDVIARFGIWLFALSQAVLIWIWFSLHAKRLRDCGRPIGLAAGVSLLFAFSVVLLVIIGGAFASTSEAFPDPNTTSVLGLMLLLAILVALRGPLHFDLTSLIVTGLTLLAFVPSIAAVALSIWAATRPSIDQA